MQVWKKGTRYCSWCCTVLLGVNLMYLPRNRLNVGMEDRNQILFLVLQSTGRYRTYLLDVLTQELSQCRYGRKEPDTVPGVVGGMRKPGQQFIHPEQLKLVKMTIKNKNSFKSYLGGKSLNDGATKGNVRKGENQKMGQMSQPMGKAPPYDAPDQKSRPQCAHFFQ